MENQTGLEEIKRFIIQTENPRFSRFITKYKDSIAGWSMKINASSIEDLHNAWCNQYVDVFKSVKNLEKGPPKSKRFNHDIWDAIYSNYLRRKTAISTFREEAIETLTSSASSAGTHIRKLIHPEQTIASSNPVIQSNDNDSMPSTSLLLPTTLSLTLRQPGSAHFVVDNTDISTLFFGLQQYVYTFIKINNLTLESDVPPILSLFSILLLQNNNRLHAEIVPFFGNRLYQKIRTHIITSLNMIHKFPGETLRTVIQIAQNLYKKEFNRIKAAASLLGLADAAEDKLDKRLLVSAAQLVQFLPMNPTYSDILEGKLITRYIMHAMQPLFDDDERGIQLDFTFDEQVDTCSREISFTGCPDCIITQFRHQTDDGVKVGFGEVKREAVAKDHYLVNLDLLRLGTLGKNSVDSNNLTGNLSLHIVGN